MALQGHNDGLQQGLCGTGLAVALYASYQGRDCLCNLKIHREPSQYFRLTCGLMQASTQSWTKVVC